VAVLREIARYCGRRAGGDQLFEPVLLTKAVAIWRGPTTRANARLVELYLRQAGSERIETHQLAE